MSKILENIKNLDDKKKHKIAGNIYSVAKKKIVNIVFVYQYSE